MGKELFEIKKASHTLYRAMILIIVFAIGTMIAFFCKQDYSYQSLNHAVEKTSKGGEVDKIFQYKGGSFVFIKNSPSKEIGYYYEDNGKWYNRSRIIETYYNIDDNYDIHTYYVVKPKYYFIKIEKKKTSIKNLSDSLHTSFKTLDITQGDNSKTIYIGATTETVKKSYFITINGKNYNLSKYYINEQLFQ